MVIMDNIVVIALFRHGLTEENKRGGYLGWNDSPLVSTKREDYQFQFDPYEQYYCSDLQRCVTTAQLLFPNEEPTRLTELREMNFGDWQGKTYEELKDDGRYRAWIDNLMSITPPNGESFSRFAERIDSGWRRITNEILDNDVSRVAIVTHGGVVRYLLMRFAQEEKSFWDWKIFHGTGYELIFDKKALRSGGKCTSLQVVPSMEKNHG